MASRQTFQNLALTFDAWKCTAGRDCGHITVNDLPSLTKHQNTYSCFGSPNRERAIHGHIVTLQDKRLLLISTINHQSDSPYRAPRVGAKSINTHKWQKILLLESATPFIPCILQSNLLHLILSLLQNYPFVPHFASSSEPFVEHATHIFCKENMRCAIHPSI